MSYIGKSPSIGSYSMLDNLTASATASYSLTLDSVAFVPESANHLIVSLNGVIQKAGSSFTVSSSTLTFSSALTSSDSIDFVLALGSVLDIGTPSDSTVTNAKTNFVSTSSAAGLQIKGDGTTDGTLQLNCSQNSHGIKLKSPAHSTSSSYTLTFPGTDPSADKFLKTDGSGNLSFADAGGGGMTLLTSGSTTSTTSTIAITGTHVTSTYDHYKLYLAGKAEADNIAFNMRFRNSSNNGTINSGYSWKITAHGADSDTANNNSDSSIRLTNQTYLGANTNEGFNMIIDFMSPLSNTVPTMAFWKISGSSQSDTLAVQEGGSRRNDGTETHTGFTLFFDSGGDFDSFNYHFFGIHKT